MSDNKIVIANIDIDAAGLIKAAKDAEGTIKDLKKQLEKLKDEGKENTAMFKKLEGALGTVSVSFALLDDAVKSLRKQNEKLAEQQEEVNNSMAATIGTQGELSVALTETADAAGDASKAIDDLQESAGQASGVLGGLSGTADSAAGAVGGLAGSAGDASAEINSMADTATDASGAVGELNTALTENNTLTDDSAAAAGTGTQSFADFAKQFKDSFDSINVLNGGFAGLLNNADKAGGAGPLVENAFNGMASGIGGMTKSALTFIATPFGAIVAALALAVKAVATYLSNTQEGMDALTAVTRPLQAVMGALMGVLAKGGQLITAMFNDPMAAIESFGGFVKENITNRFTGLMELIPNLGKAIGLLFEGEFTEAGKVAADAVGKVALGTENITDKVAGAARETSAFLEESWKKGQKIDALQKKLDKGLADYTIRNSDLGLELEKQNGIADDTNNTFAQREAAAKKAITTLQEQNKLVLERLDDEIALFILKSKGTDAEKAELAEMQAKRNESEADQVAGEKDMQNRLDGIRQEGHDKEMARRQTALDNALAKQKQLLDLYVTEGNEKAKTLSEQLTFEQNKADKSIAILKEELRQKKITELEFKNQKMVIEQQKNANILQINNEYSHATLELYRQQHKTLINENTIKDKKIVDAEEARLNTIYGMQMEQLAKELNIDADLVDRKQKANEQLTLQETQFLTAKLQLQKQHLDDVAALNKSFTDKEEQDKKAKAALKEERDQYDYEQETSAYQQKTDLENARHDEEVAKVEKWFDAGIITKKEYEDYEKELDNETSRNKQKLAIQNMQTQLGTMQNVAGALGDAFGQSKELAIAQATMNAGQAILSIWAGTISGNPIIDAVIKGVLTATTAVKTGKQIKDITSAKKPKQPKFEKGGMVQVGGQRHSRGGTLFTGADGTRFEAEQGELIGVMNRNAARHFMAFNNAFPAGGGSGNNYFASGGIVSREVAQQGIDADALAQKIAMANAALPAPVVSVQEIITKGDSFVRIKQGADF